MLRFKCFSCKRLVSLMVNGLWDTILNQAHSTRVDFQFLLVFIKLQLSNIQVPRSTSSGILTCFSLSWNIKRAKLDELENLWNNLRAPRRSPDAYYDCPIRLFISVQYWAFCSKNRHNLCIDLLATYMNNFNSHYHLIEFNWIMPLEFEETLLHHRHITSPKLQTVAYINNIRFLKLNNQITKPMLCQLLVSRSCPFTLKCHFKILHGTMQAAN